MVGAGMESCDKSVAWYFPDSEIKIIPQTSRDIFETYVKLAPDEVIPHILRIREQAWTSYPYRCIGTLRFLDPSIINSPAYPTVLSGLKDDSKALLDLGCCFGQDIRALIHAGVPSSSIYGVDLQQTFLDLGYDLFKDKATNKAVFVAGDIFDTDSATLDSLEGKFDYVHTASFLHLFNLEQQVIAAKRIATFLKNEKGVMVLGRQVGSHKPGAYRHMYRHDAATFAKLWKEDVGGDWKVEVVAASWGLQHDKENREQNVETASEKNDYRMPFYFTVTRTWAGETNETTKQ